MNGMAAMNRRDGISALVLLALSLIICFSSLANLAYGHYHRPGPGFLPFWSGVILGLLSMGLLVQSIVQGPGSSAESSGRKWNRAVLTLAALVAYGVLFGILGYFLCNLFFMVFMILLMERKKWYWAVGGGLVTALAFYLIFSVWLQLSLPRGIILP